MRRSRKEPTSSRTSPKGDKRGCLCPDGKSYSVDCCDGSLQAQGIGNITMTHTTYYYKLQKCGHSSHKEIYIQDTELIVGNVYYFNFGNTVHSGCYTVTHVRTSAEHKVNSVVSYSDCDACTSAN
tara:strand:- start:3891 stop:4265 length:375 start_codon:yes stop_codon:yes gene_type:complete